MRSAASQLVVEPAQSMCWLGASRLRLATVVHEFSTRLMHAAPCLQAPEAAAAGALLVALPIDVLEAVCRQLPLRDRWAAAGRLLATWQAVQAWVGAVVLPLLPLQGSWSVMQMRKTPRPPSSTLAPFCSCPQGGAGQLLRRTAPPARCCIQHSPVGHPAPGAPPAAPTQQTAGAGRLAGAACYR